MALSAPIGPEDLRLQAAEIDGRYHSSQTDIAALLAQLPADSHWQPAYAQRLRAPLLPPSERTFLRQALSGLPASSCSAQPSLPLSAQIDMVRLCANTPAAFGDLLEVFARSRLGDLPEDPDLFERAIRAAIAVAPQADVVNGLQQMAHAIAQPVFERLHVGWPSSINQPPTAADIEDTATVMTDLLVAQWQTHGIDLLVAMQTDEGSHLESLIGQTERALADHWHAHPDHRRRGSQLLTHLGPPADDATVLPQHPPGQWPGGERAAQSPAFADSWSSPQPLWSLPRHPLLLAVAIMTGALLLGIKRPTQRRLAGLGVGLGMLFGLEGGLRLADITPLAQTRPLFSFTDWQFTVFPDRRNEWLGTEGGWIRQQTIAQQPADFRIVTLGASSAHASNHLIEESFSALLEQQLRSEHPNLGIEVLNLGVGGTTSNGILHVGRAALDIGADLLLIYYGHNEVAQFSQLPFYLDADPTVLSWQIWLGHSRIYSVLARMIHRDRSALFTVPTTPTAEQTQAMPSVQTLEQLKALAVENHRYNMNQLLLDARNAGCDVVLMNVATNYRFVDLQPHAIESPLTVEEAETLRGMGSLDAAFQSAQAVAVQAPSGSAPHLNALTLMAELQAERGNPEQARHHMQQAIDAAANPRVATSAIRQTTRTLASQHGVDLLNVDHLFSSRAKDGLSPPGLFWDDLHPSKEGHQLIAAALYPKVEDILQRRLHGTSGDASMHNLQSPQQLE